MVDTNPLHTTDLGETMETKGEYVGHEHYPSYGVGPHHHDLSQGSFIGSTRLIKKDSWPHNYFEDPDSTGCGTYFCPKCMDGAPIIEGER